MRSLTVLLLLSLSACGPEPLEPREPTPGHAHFTVQTYNVAADRFADAATIETVGQANADIVCLQETAPEWRPVLEQRYAEQYPHMLFHSAVGAGGLAMLSRFPLAEESIFESPNQSDPDWHPAWSVTVDTGPSGMIRILGLHLRAILSGRSSDSEAYFNVEEDHALEIRTFAASFDTTLSPSLVVGDFNEEPGGPAVRYLENAGYRSALPLFHPGQGTWSAPSLGGQLSKTLDHVFFDASFAPLNAQVVKGGNSDHIPVVARLEFVDPVF